MGKFDDKFEEMIKVEEDLMREHYLKKLEHLDKELEVRMGLGDDGFKVVEPKYAYENTPQYIEHLKRGLQLTVDEEKIKIHAAINNIERNKLNREEVKQAKLERDGKL